jgi:hypothetical protein
MSQLVQGTYQWKKPCLWWKGKRSQHIFSVTNPKAIPHNRQHKKLCLLMTQICWCRFFILTCVKSNGKSRLMIPISTVQCTELENITHEKKLFVHPPVFWWVQNLSLNEFLTLFSPHYCISTYVFLQLECSLLVALRPRQVESLSWLEPQWLWLLFWEAEGEEHGLPQELVSLSPLKKQSTNSRDITS